MAAHPDLAARVAFKNAVEAAIKALAEKYGLVSPITEHTVVRYASSRTLARPISPSEGDLYVMIDIQVKRW